MYFPFPSFLLDMSSPPPATIHVLAKNNYTQHTLVTLPQSDLPALPKSSLRLRSRILGLTTNNLTYARLGHFLGWYDVYPIPPNTPAPYNNTEVYGRIAAWGYAEIVQSTVEGIKAGQSVFGYLPISTELSDTRIEWAKHAGQRLEDQVEVTSEHRQHLWKVYNRLQICEPIEELERKGGDGLGWDALMQVLFGTSYNLSTYGFSWIDDNRIHPSGVGEWTRDDADLKDSCMVLLNASGKTALAFAYALRHCRPEEYQPKTIVGVGSSKSVGMIAETGLYDVVALNEEYEESVKSIEAGGAKRVVLINFGARPQAAENWSEAVQASSVSSTLIAVGAEVEPQTFEAAQASLGKMSGTTVVNANLLREKGIEVGGGKYFEDFYAAWETFKGDVKGVGIEWGEGMEGWKEGWEKLCRDEIRGDRGLVYRV
jgi:hypothetical protein